MRQSVDRILTTHTGSLPRPAGLTDLFVRRARGEAVDAQEIAAAGHAAVRTIVAKQAEAGIDVGNNGEQPRDSFFLYLKDRLTGLGGSWQRPSRADVERYPPLQEALAGADLRAGARLAERRTADGARRGALQGHGGDRSRMPRVQRRAGGGAERFRRGFHERALARRSRGDDQEPALRHDAAYLAALGEALRVEYEAIVGAGFVLQIDAPDLALERHISFKDKPLGEFLEFVEAVVSEINRALRNVPPERVRLHVCWGNSESPHDCDVPLEAILPVVRQAKVGGFVLPFAGPRHAHEFRCFEKYPLQGEQVLVAGVIDPLTNIVEHPEVVADRIERTAAVVGDPTRVLAGTDCGFDTLAGWGRVAEDVVWAKLRSLREGAELATSRLY